MLERIFQHYEGSIEELSGLKISSFKTLIDHRNDDAIVLMWIGTDDEAKWYRIFIDGSYCGVDYYKEDNSDEDIDDDLCFVDYECMNGEIIVSTHVELGNRNYGLSSILLTIDFESSNRLHLYCHDADGVCKLILYESYS